MNVFHARLDGESVQFGSIELPVPAGVSGGGASGAARVFVRPHDVNIDTRREGASSIEARVARIHAAGSSVRLELRTGKGQVLAAVISQGRFAGMHLELGGTVYVRPRHIRVFATEPWAERPRDDYEI